MYLKKDDCKKIKNFKVELIMIKNLIGIIIFYAEIYNI